MTLSVIGLDSAKINRSLCPNRRRLLREKEFAICIPFSRSVDQSGRNISSLYISGLRSAFSRFVARSRSIGRGKMARLEIAVLVAFATVTIFVGKALKYCPF